MFKYRIFNAKIIQEHGRHWWFNNFVGESVSIIKYIDYDDVIDYQVISDGKLNDADHSFYSVKFTQSETGLKNLRVHGQIQPEYFREISRKLKLQRLLED